MQETIDGESRKHDAVVCGRCGLGHGVGHPSGGWAQAKAPQYRRDSVFAHLAYHSEWLEVADTVIEATQQTLLLGPAAVSLLLGHLPTALPSE